MMRIATWNVERPKEGNSYRTRGILKRLGDINADIWILTETHDAVRPGSGFQSDSSPTVKTAPISHKAGEHKVTIWSRWPMSNRYEVSTSHRAACVTVETPIGVLIVYATVIPYHAARWPYGTTHNWDAHYAAVATQGADWGRLRRKYPTYGLCVAGDFNQNRTGGYRYGTKWGRSLLDLALKENDLIGVTQLDHSLAKNLSVREGELFSKSIDHICLSKLWASRATGIGVWPGISNSSQHLSDHISVYVDLSVD
jgi:endonuclease/exonuclease/phosphatase family metal-dependent hydrolase